MTSHHKIQVTNFLKPHRGHLSIGDKRSKSKIVSFLSVFSVTPQQIDQIEMSRSDEFHLGGSSISRNLLHLIFYIIVKHSTY